MCIPKAVLCALFVLLQKLCSAMAVIQHVTHTAIFSWMLVEGIHLYIKLVKVFSVKKLYITYIIIGWGKIFAKWIFCFKPCPLILMNYIREVSTGQQPTL